MVRACVTIYSITSIVSAPISQHGNQSAHFIPRNNKESGSTIHSILSRYMRSPVRFPRWIYSESCMPPPLYMLSRGVGRGITFFHFNVYTVGSRPLQRHVPIFPLIIISPHRQRTDLTRFGLYISGYKSRSHLD